MKVTLDDGWTATVTDDPLAFAPRFEGTSVRVGPYLGKAERERFLRDTFGSGAWLWDTPDEVRFDPVRRDLVGVEFQLPHESASAEDSARVPDALTVRPGGLRADQARGFRLEMCSVLCRAPGDAVLTALRDLDVLDEPLEALIGIAPDLALLVQHGTAVGWSLTDPARHLTPWFTAPDPAPPSPATRRLLTECLDLITTPVIDDLTDGEPVALARLRATDEALRAQHEDRHRADALRTLIATLVEDYANQSNNNGE
ncbi:hypothetical protein [Streptomyces sp. DH12]|uniref:hypothetical protein n=1 Tax=Streptomyces sp. DH12 TaxID=2857010 RepID=UPI001E308BEB|nr:hypothetical protein [Streptomyces sp. DH12]